MPAAKRSAAAMPPQPPVTDGEHMDDDNDMDDDDDDADVRHPQKKFFRTRAHVNVLNANDFWYPPNPAAVPFSDYYPALVANAAGGGSTSAAPPPVEFVDIGCGYGSLMFELAKVFKETPMLGIEIRTKVVDYVQKRTLALREEARKATSAAAAQAAAHPADVAAAAAAADASCAPTYENVWAVHNNAMRFMPNFFHKGQLTKLFFCFADPHFKRKNHRKRIVSQALLAEYAYVMRPGGLAYIITDVSDLMMWIVGHFSQNPLFERLPRGALTADPAVRTLILTDEGLKVTRNNGNMYIAVFRKRLDPLAPREPSPPNDNADAALAAADAGYTPQAGGERRGMTW